MLNGGDFSFLVVENRRFFVVLCLL
jgi:hypothetical protein